MSVRDPNASRSFIAVAQIRRRCRSEQDIGSGQRKVITDHLCCETMVSERGLLVVVCSGCLGPELSRTAAKGSNGV